MKRIGICILCLALMLCSCGTGEEQAEKIRDQYTRPAEITMEAEAMFRLPEESRSFTLRCICTPEGATTTVLAPKELEGLSATVAGEKLLVSWAGAAVSVFKERVLSPAVCIPWMLYAAAEGYLTEAGEERLEDTDCLRLALDTTAPDGEKILCTVWFDKDGWVPCYTEFSKDGAVLLTLRTLSFERKEKEG